MSQKLIELKHRMRSVGNIQSTTQTMSTVSAAKLARSRAKALSLRAYAERMREIVSTQSSYFNELGDISFLFKEKERGNKIDVMVITSDIGMCGGYNGQICRLAQNFLEKQERKGYSVGIWSKGLKGEEFFRRKTKYRVDGYDPWSPEGVSLNDAVKLLYTMSDLFSADDTKELYCAYTKFISTAKREPTILRILPIGMDTLTWGKEHTLTEWIYEPGPLDLLAELIPTYLRIQVFNILLESYASEQGARMMAMEEASDRAEKTLKELGIQFNRIRRDLVTLDLLGILSAAKVIEKEAASSVGF
jgi:F-type H+-transporting ATPase subunit gamma